ncbi:MAG: trypsin-like peptidase domain-containing protein [Lachnospiraceae bacterium]|nr:trypsin-like peptidase domain-containing protein [Lachnospiraceae bacterium]
MYENEYGKIENGQQPYVTPPTGGGYSDYTGYTAGPDMIYNNQVPPKKKTGRIVGACIALTLVGLMIGTGITYAYMNGFNILHKKADTVAEESIGLSLTEKPEHIELSKNENEGAMKVDDLPTTSAGSTMSVTQIAESCMPSVVAITNNSVTEIQDFFGRTYTYDSSGEGSGVIIAQTDDELLILTNYHVVEDNKSLSVVFSWEEDVDEIDEEDVIYATVKDYDKERDIAVISIPISSLSNDVLSKISIATVGSSDDLKLGEQVVAIGNALGYGQSVTTGIVSALNRHFTDERGNVDENAYIQTDAAINFGNSGGALFNMKGELIGINTAMMDSSVAENMGLAIPISDVTGEVESMMNQETRETVSDNERGYLGINIVDVTSEISETYGLPEGIYVSNVAHGSGAEAAGIEKENIITGINGRAIKTSEELTNFLSKYKKGETVTVTIAYHTDDGYETKDVEVTLGNSPT